jgi:amidohydrolase
MTGHRGPPPPPASGGIDLPHLPASVRRLFSPGDVTSLLGLRRDLHQNPELSWREVRTADRLEQAVGALRPVSMARVAKTGIVARIKGREAGAPVVAIRGDIDALPIMEATGLPFTSSEPGVMHACGHDVHATWAVGAALLLSRTPARGDVIVILQPAEEVGEGATAIIKSGALSEVRAIFGGHVDRRFEVGQVVADAGPLAASADTFAIELVGEGAHGARPHESADPVVGAGALIMALQTIVSRRLNPATPGVVTVGSVHAGTAPNIIPDRAMLTGTVRSVDPASRILLNDEIKRIAGGVAAAHGLKARVKLQLGTPPLVNAAQPTGWARQAVAGLLGEPALVPLGFTNMAGEDFAFYLEKIPGCFLRIGAREPDGAAIAAHSPKFHPAEESIFVGAAVLAAAARVAGEELS